MLTITQTFKAPLNVKSRPGHIGFLSFFKYELIKALIFLILFFASVVYVNSQSKEYYKSASAVTR